MGERMEWLRTILLAGALVVTAVGLMVELRAYNQTTEKLAGSIERLAGRLDEKDDNQDRRLDHHEDLLTILRRYHDLE